MELIIDANILFSALIKNSHTRHIIVTSGWTFYVPEFLFEELEEHLDELSEKTGLKPAQLKELLQTLLLAGKIHIVPTREIQSFLKKAAEITPDPDDLHYFALAHHKKCPIWSNDKKIKEQKHVKVYSTQELT